MLVLTGASHSTPVQGTRNGGPLGGVTLHMPQTKASPPKQVALLVHLSPTSPLPSGLHERAKPLMSQRSPAAQSASVVQASPVIPAPAAEQMPAMHCPFLHSAPST